MTKARLYWHIFATSKAPAIVAGQLRFVASQPFPVTAVITSTVDGNDPVDEIADQLSSCKQIDRIKIIPAKDFEYDTLALLYEEAAQYDYVGYFHAKGAVNEYRETWLWRNFMDRYSVGLSEDSIHWLEEGGYDYLGALGTNGLPGQKPYIAGNYWWARSSYIQRLPYPTLSAGRDRMECELWIALGDGRRGAYQEFDVFLAPITAFSTHYCTDKNTHSYMRYYDLYLMPFRCRQGKLLEIGVWPGESLTMWQQALPQFVIEGVDIQNKSHPTATVHHGDQADREFLASLPPYDIIIDDGGHRSTQQLISLVSTVRNTQLYVIEDLHTSLPPLFDDYHEHGEITALEYLRQYPNLKPDYLSDAEHEQLFGKRIFIEQGAFSPIAFILSGTRLT